MDTFLEYLMRKKPTGLDLLKQIGIVLAALVLCLLVLFGFPMISSFLNAYIFLAIAGVVYFALVLLRNFNLEYEYIFTNGDLDIDVVKARKTRKRMVSFNTKNIELMASDKNMTYKREFEGAFAKKYDAVFDSAQGRVYHVIFSNNGERTLLTFQPPVKLLAAMQKMNPRLVNVDVEDALDFEEKGE